MSVNTEITRINNNVTTQKNLIAQIKGLLISGKTTPANKVIQAVNMSARATNKTTLTATGVKLTVEKSGIYNIYWTSYATAAGSSTYKYQTQAYVDGVAQGSAIYSNAYNNSAGAKVCSATNINIGAGQTVEIYAQTRSGSSYYTVVNGMYIEEV